MRKAFQARRARARTKSRRNPAHEVFGKWQLHYLEWGQGLASSMLIIQHVRFKNSPSLKSPLTSHKLDNLGWQLSHKIAECLLFFLEIILQRQPSWSSTHFVTLFSAPQTCSDLFIFSESHLHVLSVFIQLGPLKNLNRFLNNIRYKYFVWLSLVSQTKL